MRCEIGRREANNEVQDVSCSMGHEECLEEGSNIFKSLIQDPKDVRPHPDIRTLVYYYAMHRIGSEASRNTMFQRFLAETDSAGKLKLMQGPPGMYSDWILNEFIATVSDKNYVRSQDFFGCLSAISNNLVGTPLVWNWVRSNCELFVNRYSLSVRYFGALIPSITKTFATKMKLKEIEDFFAKYPEASALFSYPVCGETPALIPELSFNVALIKAKYRISVYPKHVKTI
nr:glutamyl aminopeptidase-like [Megalopta genalis]